MMKNALYLFIFCLFSFNGFAQVKYNIFSVEGFGGISLSFTDASNKNIAPIVGGAFQYNTTPYSFLSADMQGGKLQAGIEGNLRKFSNSYFSGSVIYNVGLGDLLYTSANTWYRRINDLYFGAGVGAIKSNVKEVQPFNYTTPNGTFTEGYNYKGTDIYFPLQVGVNIKYRTKTNDVPFAINLQYQFNFTLTDLLDGYEGSPNNSKKDMYSTFWLGIKYYFGSTKVFYTPPK
ncbi:hypothetical protein [Solitalea lacus]|uniref:hypothetical protein n=1 Tax=Solitalea lacus TaxID=2911172 RepID=UPI001EDB812F|nr:hypothetical protein [Solitalea lacus]UKJ07661.1 hypothetical protein L2B55_00505 [Solitalea lacus]